MFKIGDIITGNEDNRYGFTNQLNIMEVVSIPRIHNSKEWFKVRIIGTFKGGIPFYYETPDTCEYGVEPKYFKYLKEDIHSCPWL